jgi:hypothetical protein
MLRVTRFKKHSYPVVIYSLLQKLKTTHRIDLNLEITLFGRVVYKFVPAAGVMVAAGDQRSVFERQLPPALA